jgi:hypothetical protein
MNILNMLGRLLVVILIVLFTPLAFVLCVSQLFNIQAMFSPWHILAFWVMILIFRLCLKQPQPKQIILGIHPDDRPK